MRITQVAFKLLLQEKIDQCVPQPFAVSESLASPDNDANHTAVGSEAELAMRLSTFGFCTDKETGNIDKETGNTDKETGNNAFRTSRNNRASVRISGFSK